MTQVSRGTRPGVALPIRIHELLLSLAGRLDDDALADARQMLASAELDRSLEFVAGCLAAGGVVLSGTQHQELEELFASTYLDPSVVERMPARDDVPAYRHRFAVGAVNGIEPDYGVPELIRPVLDVLPDVRSVWCVWRLTPAGPVSGPVPHRVVLVGVGPGGFAPATAYRVEYALRRAGVRASVEVLVDGGAPTDYHQEAMRCARQVPFDDPGPGGGGGRPLMSPAEPMRAESFNGDPANATPPTRATTTALADAAAPAAVMLAPSVAATPAVTPADAAAVPMASPTTAPTAVPAAPDASTALDASTTASVTALTPPVALETPGLEASAALAIPLTSQATPEASTAPVEPLESSGTPEVPAAGAPAVPAMAMTAPLESSGTPEVPAPEASVVPAMATTAPSAASAEPEASVTSGDPATSSVVPKTPEPAAPAALVTPFPEATSGTVAPAPTEIAALSSDADDVPTGSVAKTVEAKPVDDVVDVLPATSAVDVTEVEAVPEPTPVAQAGEAPIAEDAPLVSSPETVPVAAVSSVDDGPAEDSAPAPATADPQAETRAGEPTPADSDAPIAGNAPLPTSKTLATADAGPAMAAVDPLLPIVATATPMPPAAEATPEAIPLATFPVAGLAVDPSAENRPSASGTRSAFGVEPPTIDSVRPSPEPPETPETPLRLTRPRPVESIKSVFEEGVDDEPVAFKPSPRRRDRTQDEPPARPRLVPAAPPDDASTDRDGHAAALIDDMLNTQERHLLRELQEELARREKQGNQSGPWRSGRHGKTSAPFEPGQAAVNGLPPRHDRGRGSA